MIVYKINDDKLQLIEPSIFRTEKDIQNLVENNIEEIFNIKFVASEYRIGEFRFDTVCYDQETKSFVIIEYKKDHSFSIVDQGYSYLSLMLERKSDFILDYNEISGEPIKKDEVDWSQSKIIFVSPSFTPHQRNSINFKDMPFELWEIKKFANNTITFNQFLSSSKESIKNLVNSKNKDISKVNQEIKTYEEDDLLVSSDQNVKELWVKLRERITQSDFSGTVIKFSKKYIRFCSERNQVICYILFRKKFILIGIASGTIYGDGSKGKYFADIDDYKGITKKYEHVWTGYGKKHQDKFGTDKDPVIYHTT